MDTYFSRYEVSNSDLSKLEKYFYGAEYEPEPTEAYRFGTLVDAIITEPEKVDYFRFTVDGEQYTREEFAIAEEMKKSFRKDDFCSKMTEPDFSMGKVCDFQRIFSHEAFPISYGSFEFTIPVRCKYDLWFTLLGWGGDIKSTTATTQKQFEEACWHFKYHRQRAWYMDLSGSSRDVLIGISKKNYKVFKLPIDRNSEFYLRGKEAYSDLAFKFWALYMDFFKQAA